MKSRIPAHVLPNLGQNLIILRRWRSLQPGHYVFLATIPGVTIHPEVSVRNSQDLIQTDSVQKPMIKPEIELYSPEEERVVDLGSVSLATGRAMHQAVSASPSMILIIG